MAGPIGRMQGGPACEGGAAQSGARPALSRARRGPLRTSLLVPPWPPVTP